MVYPVIISGEKAGSLTVEREGLFTVFEAELPGREGILRLSVYGGGRETYLGVMQRWRGGLYLRKKLSRAALRDFPAEIDHAGESGQGPELKAAAPEAGPETGRQAERDGEGPAAPKPADRGNQMQTDRETGENRETREDGEAQTEELLWFSAPSGVLSAFDGRHSLVAIPAQLRAVPPGADLRRIGGAEYFVFIRH